MAGIKGRSGGSRLGAGRPRKKKMVSERIKNNYLKAARELAKEFGYTIEEAILRLVYEDDVQDSVKVAVLKAYNDALLVKESEKDININKHQHSGPTIFETNDRGEMVITKLGSGHIALPELRHDPAKLIPMKENKE